MSEGRLSRVMVVVMAVAMSLGVLSAGSLAAGDGGAQAMIAKKCGSYRESSYRVKVTAKRVSCKKAKRVIKHFRSHEWTQQLYDPDEPDTMANSYFTHEKFPGWRCSSGSGGGGCRKGRARANYELGPS